MCICPSAAHCSVAVCLAINPLRLVPARTPPLPKVCCIQTLHNWAGSSMSVCVQVLQQTGRTISPPALGQSTCRWHHCWSSCCTWHASASYLCTLYCLNVPPPLPPCSALHPDLPQVGWLQHEPLIALAPAPERRGLLHPTRGEEQLPGALKRHLYDGRLNTGRGQSSWDARQR